MSFSIRSPSENESNLSSLSLDYDLYDEYKLEYDTKKDLYFEEFTKKLQWKIRSLCYCQKIQMTKSLQS